MAGLVIASLIWMARTHAHPAFDAYGWMVWGRETLAGNLNTGAAPSWKPLPYVFDLPYALFGHTQLWLWTFTATALGLSGAIFAYRIAARLSLGDASVPGEPLSSGGLVSVVAGLLGAGAYLSLYGIWRQLLITDSDPIVISLCLAAVDLHLSGRPRWCFSALLGAALGRPEIWPMLGLYGIWLWMRHRQRVLVVLYGALVPLAWFLIPGLTSKTWFQSGSAAMGFHTAILHGNRVPVVLDRVRSLYDPAQWIAIGVAFIVALLERSRVALILFGAAALWVAVEIGFAYHDWPAAPRYLMEPAVIVGVLGAAMIGRILRFVVGARDPAAGWWPAGRWRTPLRAGLAVGCVGLAVALAPFAVGRVGALQHDSAHALLVARQDNGLAEAIADLGGGRIFRCAPALGRVGNESALAWYLDRNVGQIGHKPGFVLRRGLPAVYIRPTTTLGSDWQISAVDLAPRRVARCRGIAIGLDPRRIGVDPRRVAIGARPKVGRRRSQHHERHHHRRRQHHRRGRRRSARIV